MRGSTFIVITGLGPVIHAFIFVVGSVNVDGRNKPGHDEMRGGGFGLRSARKRPTPVNSAAAG
jgi:hypothetical protein